MDPGDPGDPGARHSMQSTTSTVSSGRFSSEDRASNAFVPKDTARQRRLGQFFSGGSMNNILGLATLQSRESDRQKRRLDTARRKFDPTSLSEEEKMDLRRAFDSADTNRSGGLDRDEFTDLVMTQFPRSKRPYPQQVSEIFDLVAAQQGVINFDDFMRLYCELLQAGELKGGVPLTFG